MGEDRKSEEALVNDKEKYPPSSRCGGTNHTLDKYAARKYAIGTLLHNMGVIEEVEYEMNSEVSTDIATQIVTFAAILMV